MRWEKLEQGKLIVGGKSVFLFAPIKFVIPTKHPIRDVEKALDFESRDLGRLGDLSDKINILELLICRFYL